MPHVELYFRETARTENGPGRAIPTCQSEVGHSGKSTIAAGGGSIGVRKFRSATIKLKSFETKFGDCVASVSGGENDCRHPLECWRIRGLPSTLYYYSHRGWMMSHMNATTSNEEQSFHTRHLKIYNSGVSSEFGRMDDDSE